MTRRWQIQASRFDPAKTTAQEIGKAVKKSQENGWFG
jgi:hypothetical protein